MSNALTGNSQHRVLKSLLSKACDGSRRTLVNSCLTVAKLVCRGPCEREVGGTARRPSSPRFAELAAGHIAGCPNGSCGQALALARGQLQFTVACPSGSTGADSRKQEQLVWCVPNSKTSTLWGSSGLQAHTCSEPVYTIEHVLRTVGWELMPILARSVCQY